MSTAESVVSVPWDGDALPREGQQYCCPVQPLDTSYIRLKSVLDRAVALVLLLLALPVIGMLVLAVRLTSRGPGIYRQVRAGLGGKLFVMFKLRSMCAQAETGTGPVWANVQGDYRVTPLGYWLRRLHLDELPQLYNVVRGDMSLVGPRPERPEFVTVLARQLDGYTQRLRIMPGITGLAQINLPPDTDLESVRCKLVLDRQYIDEAGLWFDARILLCTLLRVLGLRGGKAVKLLGLQRNVAPLPQAAAESSPADRTPLAIATASLPPSRSNLPNTLGTESEPVAVSARS